MRSSLLRNYPFNQMINKNTITSVLGVVSLAGVLGTAAINAQDAVAPAPTTPPAPELTDAEVKDISSYILGLQSSQRFASSGLLVSDIDMEAFAKGFTTGLEGGQPAYPEAKLRVAMEKLGGVVEARQTKAADVNLAAGNEFLAENGKREGVKTTASGMQYEVLKQGGDKKYVAPEGGAPDNNTRFMVNYRGTLIDGTEFDKSPEGQTFPMTLQVIPGFKEALTSMTVGSKWKIFLPANLAYGPRAAGPKIGANSALIFELELVDIQKAPAPAPGAPVIPAR
jgi:FKBP-type peptidyl-prolyl cis-trans isomerase